MKTNAIHTLLLTLDRQRQIARQSLFNFSLLASLDAILELLVISSHILSIPDRISYQSYMKYHVTDAFLQEFSTGCTFCRWNLQPEELSTRCIFCRKFQPDTFCRNSQSDPFCRNFQLDGFFCKKCQNDVFSEELSTWCTFCCSLQPEGTFTRMHSQQLEPATGGTYNWIHFCRKFQPDVFFAGIFNRIRFVEPLNRSIWCVLEYREQPNQ